MKSYNEVKRDLEKAQETINTQLQLILATKREKEEVASKAEFSKVDLEKLRERFMLRGVAAF